MACSRMLSYFWEDVNPPCDNNPRRGWKYTLDHRDTQPSVHGEHMVLMLCAHNVDGLGLPHANSTHLPLPERSSRVQQEAPGSGPMASAKFSSQEYSKHSHISHNQPIHGLSIQHRAD